MHSKKKFGSAQLAQYFISGQYTVPVLLAVFQEYFDILTSFQFYFLKVVIVSIIVL